MSRGKAISLPYPEEMVVTQKMKKGSVRLRGMLPIDVLTLFHWSDCLHDNRSNHGAKEHRNAYKPVAHSFPAADKQAD